MIVSSHRRVDRNFQASIGVEEHIKIRMLKRNKTVCESCIKYHRKNIELDIWKQITYAQLSEISEESLLVYIGNIPGLLNRN